MVSLSRADLVPDILRYMAKNYVAELSLFDDTIRWNENAWSETIPYTYMMRTDNNREPVGFVTVRVLVRNDGPGALYIDEMYVAPEFRRKGIALDAVRVLVRNWDNNVCLHVLSGNEPAKSFWDCVEERLHWARVIGHDDYGFAPLDIDTEFRVYKPIKIKR